MVTPIRKAYMLFAVPSLVDFDPDLNREPHNAEDRKYQRSYLRNIMESREPPRTCNSGYRTCVCHDLS